MIALDYFAINTKIYAMRAKHIEHPTYQHLHDDFCKIYAFITNYKVRKFLKAYFAKHTSSPQPGLHYFMNLWKAIDKHLLGRDKHLLKQLVGTEIDLRNLQWIYRLKHYYKVPVSQVYAKLIPISYRISVDKLMQLAEAKSTLELNNAPYNINFSEPVALERHLLRLYKRSAILNPQTLAAALYYLLLKEAEVKNVTALSEGARYGLGPKDLAAYLIVEAEAY